MTPRKIELTRETGETHVRVVLNLDGSGQVEISTGIGFLDHLFTILTRHAGFDLGLTCRGDLEVDDHHSAEDCALTLGAAINDALGDRGGIRRFGWAYAPLDEALARAVVDLSGRPYAVVNLDLPHGKLGALDADNVSHVVRSLAMTCRAAIHLDVLRGQNGHHQAEAAFKALALALRQAVTRAGEGIPSTKGVL